MRRHVRPGTHRSSRSGLRPKCFRNESSRCSLGRQHRSFGHGLDLSVSLVRKPDSPEVEPRSRHWVLLAGLVGV